MNISCYLLLCTIFIQLYRLLVKIMQTGSVGNLLPALFLRSVQICISSMSIHEVIATLSGF